MRAAARPESRPGWEIHKQGRAGQVSYQLLIMTESTA